MIPELGHVALIIAFCLAVGLALIPMWGSMRRDVTAMNLAPTLAVAVALFVAVAFALLAVSFLQDDFTVAVVAANSNSLLPPIFKFSALWGNHEGSLLLWVLILSGWMTAVALFSRGLPLLMVARVLSVMGMIAVGFLAFSLLTSNPFERLLPNTPLDGNDLNPLLQDPGLIIHPPLLYMGYVGLSVPFAFAIAALLGGRLDASWARWSRPWTNVAWGFLSLGIMLGSWWAYYELGWGGWWFWDPVENASFMPWLMGAALVHSLAVTEKRGVFRSWTVLLAIFAFSLSLLGTFLVRSGVLTSVHAFAADPERGLFILIFLALVVGGSLLLYALRAPAVASRVVYSAVSRESLLMANNLVFTVATVVVLLGTLFPLVMDAFSLGKYSVGPPYFNAVFVPLMALVMPFMTVGPLSRWRDDTAARWLHELLVPGMAIVVIAVSLGFLGKRGLQPLDRARGLTRGVGCTRRCQGRLASPRQSRRVIALAEFDSEFYGYGGRAPRICRRRAGCRRRDAAKCRTGSPDGRRRPAGVGRLPVRDAQRRPASGPQLSCGSGGLRGDSGRTARGDAHSRETTLFCQRSNHDGSSNRRQHLEGSLYRAWGAHR